MLCSCEKAIKYFALFCRRRGRLKLKVISQLARLFVIPAAMLMVIGALPVPCEFSDSEPAYAQDSSSRRSRRRKRRVRRKEKEQPVSVVSEVVGGGKVDPQNFYADGEGVDDVDAVLVIDSSHSMEYNDPRRLRDQGAKLFIRFLSETDRVAIVSFDKEAREELPLTGMSSSGSDQVEKAISDISAEGGWTDIAAGVAKALDILTEKGRANARKMVVLLSDGKMDPHPTRGTPQEVASQMFNDSLLRYNAEKIKLYTLSLSKDADKLLLAEMAKRSNGLHWSTLTADSIHDKFSELFLSVKKPQIIPLDASGFDIDSGVKEATFYITREPGQLISIITPRQAELSHDRYPPGVKWFHAERFDIVTLSKPRPGTYYVKGLENTDGYASLVTDLKLEVKWPEEDVAQGDNFQVLARLIDGEESYSAPGLEDIVEIGFDLRDNDGKRSLQKGFLLDDGLSGDGKEGDSIYGSILKVDEAGDYKAFVTAKGPTFTRQQQIKFAVKPGMLSLELLPEDPFEGRKAQFQATLSAEAKALKAIQVKLVLKQQKTNKATALPLEVDSKTGIFTLLASEIPPGDYEIFARLTGKDKTGRKVEAQSATIPYTSEGDQKVEIEETGPAPTNWGAIISFLLSSLTSFGFAGFLWWRGVAKIKAGATSVKKVAQYVIPEELQARLEELKEKAGEEKRSPEPSDFEVFQFSEEYLRKRMEELQAESGPEESSGESGKDESDELESEEDAAGDEEVDRE